MLTVRILKNWGFLGAILLLLAQPLPAQDYSCADVDGNGHCCNVLDFFYLINYLYANGSAPLSDAQKIDGYKHVTMNDIQYFYEMLWKGPNPKCDSPQDSILPVTDDTLEIWNRTIPPGADWARVDLWLKSVNSLCAFSFVFSYEGDMAWLRLDSIHLTDPGYTDTTGRRTLIDTLNGKGVAAHFAVYSQISEFLLASLFFSMTPSPDSTHILIDTTDFPPENVTIFSRYNSQNRVNYPILPNIVFNRQPGYHCGDVNGTVICNIMDITYLISYLYKGGPPPVPLESSGDINRSGDVNIQDITGLINYLYRGGPPPSCP
jgi:Dockerin type I domain